MQKNMDSNSNRKNRYTGTNRLYKQKHYNRDHYIE